MLKAMKGQKNLKVMKHPKTMKHLKVMKSMKAKKKGERTKTWSGWIKNTRVRAGKRTTTYEYISNINVHLRFRGKWPNILVKDTWTKFTNETMKHMKATRRH